MPWKPEYPGDDSHFVERAGADFRCHGARLLRRLDTRSRQPSYRRVERPGDGFRVAGRAVRRDGIDAESHTVGAMTSAPCAYGLHAGAVRAFVLDAAPAVRLGSRRRIGSGADRLISQLYRRWTAAYRRRVRRLTRSLCRPGDRVRLDLGHA